MTATPSRRRAEHFLDVEVREADRKARDLAALKTSKASVDTALAKWRKHMDSMSRMYETLAEGARPSPLPPIRGRAQVGRCRGSGA